MKKRLTAIILSLLMFLEMVPFSVFAEDDIVDGIPQFSDEAIDAMQELCGDEYNAEEVLGALYQLGAVDENGTPILADEYNVNGEIVNTATLREMAESHITDPEDLPVIIDDTVMTWEQVRTLFAIADMEAALREAQENGIAMNDEEHIDNANSLLAWLSSGGAEDDDEWHAVGNVNRFASLTLGCGYTEPTAPSSTRQWAAKYGYGFPKYWEVEDPGRREYLLTQNDFYGISDISSTETTYELDYIMAAHDTPEHPERLWFPSFPSEKNSRGLYTFWSKDDLEIQLYNSYTRKRYAGEYDYLNQLSFFINMEAILANSGYDAEQVRITLHADSEDDLRVTDSGYISLDTFSFASSSTAPAGTNECTIPLTAENQAALLGDGLVIGTYDIAERHSTLGYSTSTSSYSNGWRLTFRASDTLDNIGDYATEAQAGSFRPAGMYFTFEVQGTKIAPEAAPNNTRLWFGKNKTTKKLTLSSVYFHNSSTYAFHYGLGSREVITPPDMYVREDINGNQYFDILDDRDYINSCVLQGNTQYEESILNNYIAKTIGTTGRLILIPTEEGSTKYTLDIDKIRNFGYTYGKAYSKDFLRYGFNADTVYDIPDEYVTNTLSYSYIDYPDFIQNFAENTNIQIGALSVGASGASMPYTATNYDMHNPIPTVFWDSASCNVTNFEGVDDFPDADGSVGISYTNGGRAVLVQSRLLTYLMSYGNQEPLMSGASFSNLTSTPYATSQFGIYDSGSGTLARSEFPYESDNPIDTRRLHIIAPALTYYPGDVIPVIVRNPNGVFGNPTGGSDEERTAWAKDNFTLTVNNRELSPSYATFRQDGNGVYGIDMLVFLYEVGEIEAGQLAIGTATIAYDGTDYPLTNDLRGDPDQGIDEELVTMMSPVWSDVLDVENYRVAAIGSTNYLEIPIRNYDDGTEIGGEYQGILTNQITSWADRNNDFILKNSFAMFTMDGDPRLADGRMPMYAVPVGSGSSERYDCLRIPLPSKEDNGGKEIVFVRLYMGIPLSGGAYISYDKNDLSCGNWNSDGFAVSGGRYRILNTLCVKYPKITYYDDESDFTVLYNNGWDTWADGLEYRSYKKAGKPGIVLSYTMPAANEDGDVYSYSGAQNFSWKSNNPSIATVINQEDGGVMKAFVRPTGVPGTVNFTLTCDNGGGDHVIEIESLTLTVVENSAEAYLEVPDTLTPIIVRKGASTNVTFASNLQQMNEADGQNTTTFTLDVYEAELSGGELVKSNDTAVYHTTADATAANPVCAIGVPEGILNTVSPLGSESYIAEISAVFTGSESKLPEDKEDGNFLARVPVKVKNYPIQIELTSDDEPYLLGGDTYTASWNVANADDSYDWRYYITDETGNLLEDYGSAGTGSFDATALTFTAPEVTGVLKRSYTLTVAAGNDVDEEGWTMAVKTIYVYNRSALDILVEGSERVTVEGDRVTMDSRSWLQQYLSDDGRTVKLGADTITFGALQTDAHLDTLISLNYGTYAWGLISDAIEWKVTGEGAEAVDLYYKQLGVFSDTATSGLETYLPTTDFSLIAVKDGEATVTAKHAMSGLSSSVTVDVDVLDHELVLFQFYPATETELTYYLKDSTAVTVRSDANGQLALYDADEIDNEARFYLRSSYNGSEYVGMSTMSALKSGERNAVNGKTYPVNLVKLQKPAEIHLYLNDIEGKPIAGKNVTVRGGVYYDGAYAPSADLFNEDNRNAGYIGGDDSSGLNDLIYTTDENGMFKVFFNMNQFTSEAEIDPSKSLAYVFEIREEGYLPEIAIVQPYVESNAVVELTPVQEADENKPFVWEFSVTGYDYFNNEIGILPIDDASVNVGPNGDNPRVTIQTITALWGRDDLIDRSSGVTEIIANPGAQYYTDRDADTCVGDDKTKGAQTYEFWAYPFSSYVFCDTVLNANETTLHWLDERTPVPMDLRLYDADGEFTEKIKFNYSLYRNIVPEMPSDSEALAEQAQKQRDQIDKCTEDFGLGDLVPGGDILATGLTFLTACAGGGDYTLRFKVSPTADPAVFYVLISVSDEDDEDDEDDDKSYKIEPSYEDIQKLGAEAISGLRGGNHHQVNYASKKKGLAAELKKEQEEMYVYGKEKKKEDKKDDDDDDDGPLSVTFGGSLMARALYDPFLDDWSLSICGGSLRLNLKLEKEYHKNIIVGYVPFTVSIGAKAELGGEAGGRWADYPYLNRQAEMFYTKAWLNGEIEGFGGLGLDVGLIAVKIGIYGKFAPSGEINTLRVIEDLRGRSDYTFGDPPKNTYKYTGGKITLAGTLGFKFVFKALIVNYEQEIFSILKYEGKNAKTWKFGDYEKIENIWSGESLWGDEYKAALSSDDTITITVEKSSMAMLFGEPASEPGSTILHTYDEGRELEELSYSEDGKKIFYLDDGVAFTADAEGVTEGAIAADEEIDDYGQYYLDAAGRDGNYAAVWVTQTCENSYDESMEPTPADLAAAMNSTEITAAVCDGKGNWQTTRLTDNDAPDLAPSVAVSEDGRYVLVAWRSVYNSDPDAPLTFDVEDNLMYRIFDRTSGEWTDAVTAYNGIANGSVYALDTAIFDNGSALIGYTVQTSSDDTEDEDVQNGLETYYTFLEKTADGMNNTTVRVTDNKTMDANAQILKLCEGTDEYAVLGWYSEEEEAGDVNLRVFDDEGNIDDGYPTSVAALSDVRISSSFRLAGSARDDLTIGWINLKVEDGADAASGDLCAARTYRAQDGSYHITPAQTLAASSKNITIDDFALYADGIDVAALLSESDYSAGRTKVAAVLTMDDIVRRSMYETTEDYEAACAEFLEENPGGTVEFLVPVADYKAEIKEASFRNEIEVTKIRWNQDTVAPMLTVPVQFTIRNNGYVPVDAVKVNGTLYEGVILPGESTKVTVNYTMDNKASDETYTISVPGDTTFPVIEDTIHFNTPGITVIDSHESSAADGKRTLVIRLGNDNMVPAKTADRRFRVGIYADAACTLAACDPIVLDENQTTLLDENAALIPIEVDAAEVLDLLEMEGEIPETGIPLYVKADTCMPNDNELENVFDTVFISTLCKDRESPVKTDCTDFTVDGNTVKGSYTIENTSIADKGNMFFALALRDENDLITAMQLLPVVDMTAEKKVADEYEIDVADASAVASVSIEILEEAGFPTLESEDYQFGGWYQDAAFETEADNSTVLGYVKWHAHSFNGDYKDNLDGTHSRKCTGCDEYSEPETHTFTDGVCVCGATDSAALGITATRWKDVTDDNRTTSFFVDGVQIRLPDKVEGVLQGMRFVASLGNDVLEKFGDLNADNVKPEETTDTGVGYGFLVIPTAKLSGELTKDTAKIIVPAVKTFNDTDDARLFTVCILGIDAAHWESDITVRPYITYKDADGIEHTAYGDTCTTNVYAAVEYGIKNDTENSEALKQLMTEYEKAIS